ncbi:hypothetical protein N9Y33_01440 [Bacteroidia bacterium]|nr:hypothetical protein [Bacteroidia bacterium]
MHSLLRWVILILLIYTLIRSFQGKAGKEAKFLTITSHIMLLIGLAQWFLGSWGLKLIQNVGIGEVMKNASQRFFAVEHTFTMIIAIALITVGGVSVRKGKSNAKWFYLIALILILMRIPWPFMEAGIARGWFPGMAA